MTTAMDWGKPRLLRMIRAETLREGDWLLVVPYVGGSPVFKRVEGVERHDHELRPWLRVTLEAIVQEREDRRAGSRVWEVGGPHALILQAQEPLMIGEAP